MVMCRKTYVYKPANPYGVRLCGGLKAFKSSLKVLKAFSNFFSIKKEQKTSRNVEY